MDTDVLLHSRTFAGFALAIVLLTACDIDVQVAEPQQVDFGPIATPDDLLALVASRNVSAIRDGLNELDQVSVVGELIPTLESLWIGDTDRLPNLPWDVLELPVVRLKIAQTLAVAHFNGNRTDQIASIHAYVREHLDSRNIEAAISALLVIDRFNDPEDVVALEGIWQRNELRRAVMSSLNTMCISEADIAAERLLSNCSDRVCDDIRESRSEIIAWKQRTGWCSDFEESQ